MKRTLTLALALVLLAAPEASAGDGPLKRLRNRIFGAPACPNGVCPAPQFHAPAPVAPAAPKVMQQAQPQVVGGPLRDRARVELIRLLAIRHAVEHGVPLADGTVKKVTRAQARKMADQVTDEQILKGLTVYGAPVGEGRLEALLDWILEHREEIAELVKWIVSLFALFADGP